MKVFNCNGMKMVDSSNFVGGLVQAPVFIGLFSAIRNIVARGGRMRSFSRPEYCRAQPDAAHYISGSTDTLFPNV
jgi:hypothetical protein